MSRIQQPRRGFTLLELIVVIAIVTVLFSLLMAGVLRVREAANRTVCRNNLRQVGLAYQGYRTTRGAFPPLAITDPARPTGWGPFIIPYLEQDVLASQYNFGVPFYDPANQAVIRTRLRILQCPSAPPRSTTEDPYTATIFTAEGVEVSWQASPADYSPLRAVGFDLVVSAGCASHVTFLIPVSLDAALTVDKPRRLADIADGASNTILLAEIAGRPELWQKNQRTGDLVDVNSTGFGGWGDGFSVPSFFGSSNDGTVSPGPCGINCTNAFGLYSFHRSGVNTVFVDGSVHFLSNELDVHDALIPLLTANGGEVISGDY
jgi:prepilin-type N-terminal cleavage/methylation domain-containing protein/prepilin-type processing-associated H-X9-DG protein